LRKLKLRYFAWDELVSDVKESLRDILALPSLVHFDACFVEVSSLESFLGPLHPQLKQLEMYIDMPGNTSSEAMDAQETAVTRQPCRLEQLGLFFRLIDWLLGSQSLIDISAVRTLCLTEIDEPTQHTVTSLLRTLGASLEHLTLCGALPNFYPLHMFMRDAPRLL
jgi:hypothetical protein